MQPGGWGNGPHRRDWQLIRASCFPIATSNSYSVASTLAWPCWKGQSCCPIILLHQTFHHFQKETNKQICISITLFLFSFSNYDKGAVEEWKFLKAVLQDQHSNVLSQPFKSSAAIKSDAIKSFLKAWKCVHFVLLLWKE